VPQEADLSSKHHSNITSSYVTLNDRAEYCPSTPFCGHVVEVGAWTQCRRHKCCSSYQVIWQLSLQRCGQACERCQHNVQGAASTLCITCRLVHLHRRPPLPPLAPFLTVVVCPFLCSPVASCLLL
jgi:hypothetical protein